VWRSCRPLGNELFEEVSMKTHALAALCVLALIVMVPGGLIAEPKEDGKQPPHEVSMEIQALRAFDDLQLTPEQIALAVKLSKETAEPERKRGEPKASEEYRELQRQLRDALAEQDDDKADEIDESLDQLADKEKPEIDDGFAVTKAARKRAAEVLKTFKPAQLAGYYGSLADDALDPLAYLIDSLKQVRGLEKDEWREKRDEIGDELAWLVAGANVERWEKVSDRVVALLSKGRSLSDADFKMQKADLEKAAKEIVGDVEADTVLRHYAERAVAELLSNPRLAAAAKARGKATGTP
jgi:hypothetical protein